MENKKSQSFSTDILIVIVVILFSVLFLVMNKVNNDTNNVNIDDITQEANQDSKRIIDSLKKSQIIHDENTIEIESLLQVDINKIKEELNINKDICIVFEQDGNLILIDAKNNITGIGNENIIINDVPCKSS